MNEIPAQPMKLDETPSGFVEVLRGADGKWREYVRVVDHEKVVGRHDKMVRRFQVKTKDSRRWPT